MNTLATQNFHLIDDQDISVMTFAAIERIHGLVATTGRKVQALVRRASGRRALARLNDHMLTDIGLIRADIDRETHKYFWQR